MGVLNSIAGLVTIPFLSALLGQAAVVFCQKQRPEQSLGLLDMFALADRGWTNVGVIWASIWSWNSSKASNNKWIGAFLLPSVLL